MCGLKLCLGYYPSLIPVTPYTGVWIETQSLISAVSSVLKSHLIQVCGLKHIGQVHNIADPEVTPYTGVWIETSWKMKDGGEQESHLIQVCGLKQLGMLALFDSMEVTPYTGVWIETSRY